MKYYLGGAPSGSIPIATMLLKYNRIKSSAIEDSLIWYDPGTNQYKDVAGRQSSPFEEKTLFAATTLLSKRQGLTHEFIFPSELRMSNVGHWDSIFIDFHDSNGWIWIHDSSLTHTFIDYGVQKLDIRLVRSGIEYTIRSSIELEPVTSGLFTPDTLYSEAPNDSITSVPFIKGVIFYGNCNKKLLKPFFFIEGINYEGLKNDNYLAMKTRLKLDEYNKQAIKTPNSKTLWKNLFNEGYDLIYVDFVRTNNDPNTGGAGDINLNATALQALINKVNEIKHANGSKALNLVLGASMGGVIGFKALRTMEVNNVKHEVENFVSFDSPFYGANLPLGLQAFVKYFGHVMTPKGSVSLQYPLLKVFKSVITSKAAKQLLMYHMFNCVSTKHYDFNREEWYWEESNCQLEEWHDNFYQDLHAHGGLQDARHITLSNGSSIAAANDLSPNKIICSFSGANEGNKWYGGFYIKELNIRAAEPGTDKIVLNYHTEQYTLLTYGNEKRKVRVSNIKPYDIAPGGITDFGLNDFLNGGLQGFTLDEKNNGASWGFVPTFSALNNSGYPDPLLPVNNCNNGSSNCISSRSDEIVLKYTGTNEHNQEHVTLNSKISTFLLDLFIHDDLQALKNSGILDNRVYNFGSSTTYGDPDPDSFQNRGSGSVIDFDIEVKNSAELNIHQPGKINFTDKSLNPNNDAANNFVVSIVKDCMDSTEVFIQSGCKMKIGNKVNNNNIAILNIMDSAKLVISSNGELELDKESVINVHKGGKLIIEGNGNVNVRDEARIVVHEGGKLIIQPGAKFNVFNRGITHALKNGIIELHPGAEIKLEDGNGFNDGEATIKITGTLDYYGEPKYSGNGYFQFDESNKLILHDTFKLRGISKATRFIQLNDFTHLNIDSFGIRARNGKIIYYNNSQINVQNKPQAYFDTITFKGEGNSTYAINLLESDYCQVSFCDFNNLNGGIISSKQEQEKVNLFVTGRSIFSDVEIGIDGYQSRHIRVDSTNFIGNSDSYSAIFLTDMFRTELNFVGITNYTMPGFGACNLTNTKYFRTRFTGINNCAQGIYSDQSNVFIHKGSNIQNNTIGIDVLGTSNFSRGLVEFSCATLQNNEVGVTGQYIIFNIDAGHSSMYDLGGVVSANRFIKSPGQKLFDCSLTLANLGPSGFTILARNNYWGGGQPVANTDYKLCTAGFCNYNTIYLETNPYVTTFPTYCSFPGLPGGYVVTQQCDADTTDNDDSGFRFMNGYSQFEQGNILEAQDILLNLAIIPDQFKWTLPMACQKYIDISRVFNDIGGNNGTPILTNTKTVSSAQIKLYPSIVKDRLFVSTLDKGLSLEIINLYGQIVYTSKLTRGTNSINAASIYPGLYSVIIRDSTGLILKNENVNKE